MNAINGLLSSYILTCQYPDFRLREENQWESCKLSSVLLIWGSEYASLMVQLFSFLRSIQNLRLPSFFWTRTTALAHGLCDFQIAPISSISLMWSLMWGGVHWKCSLKGIWSVTSILCLIRAVLPRSRSLCTNRCFHLSSNSLACFCSDSGQSQRPWRSRASNPYPFWALWFDSSEVLVGWTTSGTWLAGATCPTTVFVGISMVWVLKLHRQIGTLEDPRCSCP